MTDSIQTLVGLLDLEAVEAGMFRGRSPETSLQRVFGGQVAAQALAAAGRTVDSGRQVHSMHAYFLRPGTPEEFIFYQVHEAREGRSFSTRRVVASQQDRAIFSMSASFQAAELGVEHGEEMPSAPDPETLPTLAERVARDPAAWSDYYRDWFSFDVRVAADPRAPLPANNGLVSHCQAWFRATAPLPDDPLIKACALTYASDLTLLAATLTPHGLVSTDPQLQIASLDHAVWFHRPVGLDDWLLYDQTSPSAANGRGLASGRIFSRDGRLVASVMQEGLIRVRTG